MDRRDQVLITVLVPFSFWTSTFFIRWSSTKGPFLRLRGIGACSYRLFLPRLRRRLISRSLGLCSRRVRALLGEQLDPGARGPRDLRPATGAQLDRVDDGTRRDRPQRQRVTGLDV